MTITLNEKLHLLLIRPKGTQEWEDQTGSVRQIRLAGDQVLVTYRSGPNTYSFNTDRARFFQNPESLAVGNAIVFVDGRCVRNVKQGLKFGAWIKLFTDGVPQIHPASKVRFDRNSLQEPEVGTVMSYLKAIASLHTSGDHEGSFLKKELDGIDHLSEESILTSVLRGEALECRASMETIVFPFGVNQSQIKAVEDALTNRISIIQGPPGTGKTQTILSIIANLLIRDKTVAVVSSNNSATDNVYEKLESEHLAFVSALLGNKVKRERFFADQQLPSNSPIPIPPEWELDVEVESGFHKLLKNDIRKLSGLLDSLNERADLKEKLRVTQVEMERYDATVCQNGLEPLRIPWAWKRWPSNRLLRLMLALDQQENAIGFDRWLQALRIALAFRVSPFFGSSKKATWFGGALRKCYYRNCVGELHKQIATISAKLGSMGFDELMRQYRDRSRQLLRCHLWKRYKDKKPRAFNLTSPQKEFEGFSDRFPVILSTTNAIRRCIQKGCLFDYVIIDESSQVDLVTASLALSCCRNLVVVGDLLQLPHIVEQKIKDADPGLLSELCVPDAFHYSKHNILSSLNHRFGTKIPRTLLREHYRCHPKIIRFCNQKYYEGELVIMTDEQEGERALSIVRTAPGNHQRFENGSWHNQRQLDVIREEILPELNIDPGEIGVVTPYREQADRANSQFVGSGLLVATVHKFQGREKRAIILSPVVSNTNAFNDDPNLINVAVSRAKERLVVVLDHRFSAPHGSNLGDLVRYIEFTEGGASTQQSNVVSIFDCLYTEYSAALDQVMKRMRRVSAYKSENLMHALLHTVLEEDRYAFISIVMHYPLWDLVSHVDGLTDVERAYAMHPFTHVDFVLFNRLNKEPLLAIEVDGYQFHSTQSRVQHERDVLKNAILSKTDIPFERFSTIGSGEKERLVALLGNCIANNSPIC